jgi:hypothetical protein
MLIFLLQYQHAHKGAVQGEWGACVVVETEYGRITFSPRFSGKAGGALLEQGRIMRD